MRSSLITRLLFTAGLILPWSASAAPAPRNPPAATSFSANYADPLGHEWTRWVLTEPHLDGRLLLVVDQPKLFQASSIGQMVRYRKFFSAKNASRAQTMLAHFRGFADLADRPASDFAAATADSTHAPKPIWTPTKNAWTLDDEKAYSAWFTNTVTDNYLVGSGFDVDCADFALAVRWTYAHDHLMPAANTLAGSGKLFGHWSGRTDWDLLATNADWRKDARFKAALHYLLESTYTHSITLDLYPVELDRDFVNPGSILLTLYSEATGHTQVINTVGKNPAICGDYDCLTTIFGNEPAAETAQTEQAWIVNGGPSEMGFSRWKWPVLAQSTWSLTPAAQMPGYSLEQYSQTDLDNLGFGLYVDQKLGLDIGLDAQGWLQVESLQTQLSSRETITAIGWMYCGKGVAAVPCDPSDPLYDDYSTPSKDARLQSTRVATNTELAKFAAGDPTLLNLQQYLLNPILGFEPIPPIALSMADYLDDADGVDERMSSDPTQPFETRWGQVGLDLDTKIKVWAMAWTEAWWSGRVPLADQGIAACFPNGTGPTCDGHSPTIQDLSSARIDFGLAAVRTQILAALPQLKAETKAWLVTLGQQYASVPLCMNSQGAECTVGDYLLTKPGYFDRMSSDPTADSAHRYGYQH